MIKVKDKIRGYTVFLLAVLLFFSMVRLTVMFVNAENIDFEVRPFDASKEKDYAGQYEMLLKKISAKSDVLPVKALFSVLRNDKKENGTDLYVKKIVFKPFLFKYMGYVEKDNNEVIAQINFNKKTYFVKSGDFFEKWFVASIAKNEVVVIGPDGEEMRLPIRKNVFSKKPYAVLGKHSSPNIFKVFVGEDVDKYKVLDIRDDAVILKTDSETLTLNK